MVQINHVRDVCCYVLFRTSCDFCNSDWICESAMDILLILYNCVFVIDLCILVIYILRILRLDR